MTNNFVSEIERELEEKDKIEWYFRWIILALLAELAIILILSLTGNLKY